MKKICLFIAVALAAGFCLAASPVYVDTTATIAAGATSVTITNTSTTGFVWTIEDVYGLLSAGATDADTLTMYKALAVAPTVFYPVDSGSIASNGVSVRIDVDGIVQLSADDLLKFVRTSTSTNAAISLLIPNMQAK